MIFLVTIVAGFFFWPIWIVSFLIAYEFISGTGTSGVSRPATMPAKIKKSAARITTDNYRVPKSEKFNDETSKPNPDEIVDVATDRVGTRADSISGSTERWEADVTTQNVAWTEALEATRERRIAAVITERRREIAARVASKAEVPESDNALKDIVASYRKHTGAAKTAKRDSIGLDGCLVSPSERGWPSHEDEYSRIESEVNLRGITALYHFTRCDNLNSILSMGIRSVEDMEIDRISAVRNDEQRLDGKLNGISLSISFPNHKMFYKYRMSNTQEDWVVLRIKAEALYSLKCGYFEKNAADHRMRNMSAEEYKNHDAFIRMFWESDDQARSGWAKYHPTDVQAEVMIFEQIPAHYIQALHFETEDVLLRWSSIVKGRKTVIEGKGQGLFGARRPRPVSLGERHGGAPVFHVYKEENFSVRTEDVEFKWFPGMSLSQRQHSARSLAESVQKKHPGKKILEVSRMSDNALGVKLSAFNLVYPAGVQTAGRPVECVFQSSKVFRDGGPYCDLLEKSPKDAKTDSRLKSSGPLIKFDIEGETWPNQPLTAFYDWIYLLALRAAPQLANDVSNYDIFTDIAFNPKKSFSCQAKTIALFVALRKKGIVDQVLKSREAYFSYLNTDKDRVVGSATQMKLNL